MIVSLATHLALTDKEELEIFPYSPFAFWIVCFIWAEAEPSGDIKMTRVRQAVHGGTWVSLAYFFIVIGWESWRGLYTMEFLLKLMVGWKL